MPAAIATGFPESVPAWYIDPNGATFRMISSFAPYAPTGNPPADDLAQARNVGKDPVHRLRAAGVDAEAGYYLVEDQQSPVFAGQFTQSLEKPWRGFDHAHIPGHGLDDHGRDLVAVRGEQRSNGVQIVVRRD